MVQDSKRVTVLLVEGDPLQRMLLREYLEQVPQYEVLEAEGAFHVLATCESHLFWPAVLLLDMEWHRGDGLSIIGEVKRRTAWLPILGMTDRDQSELYGLPQVRKHSVGLIRKPFSPLHLHRSIRAVLNATGRMERPLSRVQMRPGTINRAGRV